MTREEQLKLCSVCKNRKVDLKRGLVCSLTDEYATFDGECKDYVIDQEESERKEKQAEEIKKSYRKQDLYNDVVFCLIFSFFSARGHGLPVFFITLVIIALGFVLSNCLLIQYEKKKGERLNDAVRSIIKDAFAILVVFLVLVAL